MSTIAKDQFKRDLESLMQELSQWSEGIDDVADVSLVAADGIVRLACHPDASGACAFEFGIREDQLFDLSLDAVLFEDLEIHDLDFFVELATAIADGQVVKRTYFSAQTGIATGFSIIVPAAGGALWSGDVSLAPGFSKDSADVILSDAHYLPFRIQRPAA